MERQDRLLPTPMPPEEKQALRAKAKEDVLRGFGLLGTDILGSVGDIGGIISKFLPVAGGQSMDDLYAGTKKPSQVLEEGIGSIAFQKAFNINPTGSFGENLSRFGGSAIPLSASGIVNTLKAPKKILGALRQSMVTPEGVVLKMNDVPRTNAEVLMSEASGTGGMKPKPETIDINQKNRDTNEITFGSALSTDKSIYSRLIFDLENINKRGGMSIPNNGISPQEAINVLSGRPTFLEAQESGLLAYLQRRVDMGDNTLITRDKMLEIARGYKPNINKRTYSLSGQEKLRKDTSWKDNMKSEDATKIVDDYSQGILNAKEQLPYNIELVATDYKITHFNDITQVNPADKLRKDSFMGTKIRGLDGENLPQGYHDYGETDLNPGYFGHIRNADVKLDPNLNDGLSDGVIAIEHQMNLAGNKDLNQSLRTLPGRIQPQKDKIKAMEAEIELLDIRVVGSYGEFEKLFQNRFNRKPNNQEIEAFEKTQKIYSNSDTARADRAKRIKLKTGIVDEKLILQKMERQLKKGTDQSDRFGIASAKRRDEIAEGKETEELIPEYKAENNEKFLNILTNEDRVLIDEIAKIDVKEGVGLSTFRTNKKNLDNDLNRLDKEVEDLNIQLSQYDDLKDSVTAQGLAGENAVGALKVKAKIKPDIPVSPFSIYDSRGDLAIDPFFEMFVDAEKLGVNENFKLKLSRNQLDGEINSIVDYEKKTASMDLGFFQKVKKELKGETTRKDNKNIVDNVMKSEASNYYETQKLTTEFVEKIRSNPKFYENFDEDTITNLKARFKRAEKGSDEFKKANFDLNIVITEAIENSGVNLNKMATELVEKSIKDTRQIPAFSPQTSKNPTAHKKQAILDLIESITTPTTVKVPGTIQKTNNGRPVINRLGPVMEDVSFDGSINSIDNLNILKARLGKNAYDEEISFLEDKVRQSDKTYNDLLKKNDVEFGPDKFLELSRKLRKKLTDKKLQDVFLRAMKHEADEMMINGNRPISKEDFFKNAPFPNLKKAGQFLARSNIEQAIEDGKQFIAFPSRRDYAVVRQRSGPGEFEAVFGKTLDNVLKEYAKKGAILKNQVISAADKATVSNTIARDPMRVLDIRPLLGKKKEAIPRMAMGGLFEKFRKAG